MLATEEVGELRALRLHPRRRRGTTTGSRL
jgi:hypothetical protein